MGSLNPEDDPKQELNDSGYVQDDTPKKTMSCSEYKGSAALLDLSDDVLLYILQYCKTQDLKALGYTCVRLGTLILDRTLWQRVDARGPSYGIKRMMWLLTHALSEHTNALLLSGFAHQTKGCLGYVKPKPEDQTNECSASCDVAHIIQSPHITRYGGGYLYWPKHTPENQNSEPPNRESVKCPFIDSSELEPPNKVRKLSDPEGKSGKGKVGKSQDKGKMGKSQDKGKVGKGRDKDKKSDDSQESESNVGKESESNMGDSQDNDTNAGKSQESGSNVGNSQESECKKGNCPGCKGKAFDCPGLVPTVTPRLLERLKTTCEQLTELALEYCVINCANTSITHFPSTLKKLSLRGTMCYNMDKTFISKINVSLPLLEELDVSFCDWLEPSCMMVLGKMENLSILIMRGCSKMSEFVAYASLAARYGFKTLRVLDLRGTPVGDSEVSALGWISKLEELYLSPATPDDKEEHAHCNTNPKLDFEELEEWELEEPEYFKSKNTEENKKILEDSNDSEPKHSYPLAMDTMIQGMENNTFKRCTNIASEDNSERKKETDEDNKTKTPSNKSPETDVKRKNTDAEEAGPSKRPKMNEKCATKASLKYFDDYTSNSNGYDDMSSKYDNTKNGGDSSDDDDDDDDDDDSPQRVKTGIKVNQGASTSKDIIHPSNTEAEPSNSTCRNPHCKSIPDKRVINIIVQLSQGDSQQNNNDGNEPNLNRDEEAPGSSRDKFNKISDRDLHTYLCHRMVRHSARVLRVNLPSNNNLMDFRLDISSQANNETDSYAARIEYASLVTDSSIRRFGRADGDIIQYVQIDPRGPISVPFGDGQARPDRSNLRILSVTGFHNITDASLTHLMTAAPHLELLDVSGTRVTDAGVEHFRNMRSNCEVRHGPVKPDTDWKDVTEEQ